MDARAKFQRKFGGYPRYSDRQLVLYAALTALGANLIFWGPLFKSRAPETTVRDSSASLELLDLNAPDSGYLKRWISYHDPAKSGSSNYHDGFSAQLPRRELVEPPAMRPRHTVELKAAEVRKFQPLELAERKQVPALPLAASAELPAGESAASGLPRATDDRGREIPVARAALPEPGKQVTADTLLHVTSAGGKRHLVVWQSCGDRVLDGHAAALVDAAVEKLDPPPGHVIVRWPRRAAADKAGPAEGGAK